MEFSKYRSQALKALWVRVRNEFLCDERYVINRSGFSTWQIDDICAVNWKSGNPVGVCVSVLMYYVEGLMVLEV